MTPSFTTCPSPSLGTMMADSKGVMEIAVPWRSDKVPVMGGNQAPDAELAVGV